jgi:high-affinity nickel-transport protein
MIQQLIKIFNESNKEVRSKLFGIYSVLIVINALAWAWAFSAFHNYPILLGTALLAYSFGLRHAVDADHIAAIDNVTRKLMQQKKRPVTVGLFFSLGHSSVVIIASALVAIAAIAMKSHFNEIKQIGAVISTTISACFLLLIALMNTVIFCSIWKAWKRVKAGAVYIDDDFDMLLAQRGFFARIFRPLFRVISHSWHMYPLGFLFGLGFDTATEVSLMGISATQAAQGMSPWNIMIFPLLFSAGMSLVDTIDGHLMLGAYGWAYMKPIRKIYYNMSITLISIFVAVLVGGVEALGLLASRLGLSGSFWDFISMLNDNFGTLGYFIIIVFVVSWLISVFIYKINRLDSLQIDKLPH